MAESRGSRGDKAENKGGVQPLSKKERVMRSFNRTVLIGNVGGDAVLRHTNSGKAVVNLSLATNSRRQDEEQVTTWHRVVLWNGLAEVAQRYVKKGQALYIEGPTTHREWTDANGVGRNSAEVTAREMIMLSGPRATEGVLTLDALEPAADGEELDEVIGELPL